MSRMRDQLLGSAAVATVGGKLAANGWTGADVDTGARAIVEKMRLSARSSSLGHGQGAYVPMTDEEWAAHRHLTVCGQAILDTTTVLEAVERFREAVKERRVSRVMIDWGAFYEDLGFIQLERSPEGLTILLNGEPIWRSWIPVVLKRREGVPDAASQLSETFPATKGKSDEHE